MHLGVLFFGTLLCFCQAAPLLRFFTVEEQYPMVALLDPETGELTCKTQLGLPSPPDPDCVWTLGNGHRGITSTVFYMNQTVFFLGQLLCIRNRTFTQTMLFRQMGPWCDGVNPPTNILYPVQKLAINPQYLDYLNINWDHTCNVVVLTPVADPTTGMTTIKTDQISTYDGQIRPQPDYATQPTGACQKGDCWIKTNPGISVLSRGTSSLRFDDTQAEWNCGDSCVLYSVEKHIINGIVTPPEAFVGRYFRTGELHSTQVLPFSILSISYDPFQGHADQFLGVANCCFNSSWCLPECAQFSQPTVILFQYLPSTNKFTFLSEVAPYGDAYIAALGVEFSPMWRPQTPFAYVMAYGSVLTFSLQVQNGVVVGAKRTAASPKVQLPGNPLMWAPRASF